MTRATRTRFALCIALLVASTVLSTAQAQAGAYYVRSCFPDGVDRLWTPTYSAGAVAYKSCPEGIHARNVIGPTPAPGFTYARLTVNAPAGTYIDQIAFDGYLNQTRDWHSGLFDLQNARWVWCGNCAALPLWYSYRVGGFATRSLAF